MSNIGNLLQLTVAIVIAITIAVLIPLQAVDANGSVRRYEVRQIGRYEIGLGTVPASPTVGMIHFAVYVKDVETGISYTDAKLSFVASAPNSQDPDIGPILMLNTVMDPTYYELNVSLDKEGIWFVMLEVEASTSNGKSSVIFEINVQQTNPIVPILTVGTLLSVLVILGISARAWIKEYKRKSYTKNR
jgi:hypothetical protein